MDIVLKALIAMGMKLLTTKVIEEMFLFATKRLVELTDTRVDDEFYKIVEKAIKGENA